MSDRRRWHTAPLSKHHGAPVTALALAPNSDLLATGGDDSVVRLWDLRTGALLQAFDAHAGWDGIVEALMFDGDDLWVVAGGAARCYRPGSGLGRALRGFDRAEGAAWPYLYGVGQDGAPRWWDVRARRFVALAPDEQPRALRASGEALTWIDPVTQEVRGTLPLPREILGILGISDATQGPDGQLALFGRDHDHLHLRGLLWLGPPGGPWRMLPAPDPWTSALLLPGDGRLVVADGQRRVHVLRADTGEVLRVLPAAIAAADLRFSADGRQLHVAYDGLGVGTWDLAARRLVALQPTPAGEPLQELLDADGRLLVASWRFDCARVVVRDLTGGPALLTLDADAARREVFRRFAAAWPWVAVHRWWPGGGALEVWDLRTGARVLEQEFAAFGLQLHPRGLLAFSVRTPRWGVEVLDLATGAQLGSFPTEGGCWPFAFSPDGARLLISGEGRMLWSISLDSGETRATRMDRDGASRAAWSPDGTRLACVRAYDAGVVVWQDGDAGARTLRGHRGIPRAAAFSPDGARLATCAQDGSVLVWSVRHGRRLYCLPGP